MKTGKMDQKGPLQGHGSSGIVTSSAHTRIQPWFASDVRFHTIYPESLHAQANMHWTPLHIARKAADFLAAGQPVRILDIGSGAGKFCLAAAFYQPSASYTGIEQREELVFAANHARDVLGLQQVLFKHGNLVDTDLADYDHFYFFNAFFENLEAAFRIDHTVPYSGELYARYNRYLFRQLQKKPSGTRLATFHSTEAEVPGEYHEVGATEDGLLKFWVKV